MANWKKISSKIVHQNPWYKIREDKVVTPSGKDGTYTVIEDGWSVFMVPVTDEGKILMIKLFRYPTQSEGWELPAGAVEQGEDHLEAAKRELREETGFAADEWQHLGDMESYNSKSDARGAIFLCKGLSHIGDDEQEDEGITKVTAFTEAEIMDMVRTGQIVDSSTLSPLMMYFARLA